MKLRLLLIITLLSMAACSSETRKNEVLTAYTKASKDAQKSGRIPASIFKENYTLFCIDGRETLQSTRYSSHFIDSLTLFDVLEAFSNNASSVLNMVSGEKNMQAITMSWKVDSQLLALYRASLTAYGKRQMAEDVEEMRASKQFSAFVNSLERSEDEQDPGAKSKEIYDDSMLVEVALQCNMYDLLNDQVSNELHSTFRTYLKSLVAKTVNGLAGELEKQN